MVSEIENGMIKQREKKDTSNWDKGSKFFFSICQRIEREIYWITDKFYCCTIETYKKELINRNAINCIIIDNDWTM